MTTKAYVAGTGSYLPECVFTNQDLEDQFANGPQSVIVNDAWIRTNFGIKKRHVARDPRTGKRNELNSDMAAKAAKAALADAGIEPDEVDMLVCTTATPDKPMPPMVLTVQEKVGIHECGFVETRSACSGVAQAMIFANELIRGGVYRTVLVVGSEFASAYYDLAGRANSIDECLNRVMFGDGAGAIALRGCDRPDRGIIACTLRSVGYGRPAGIEFPFGGSEQLVRGQDQERVPWVRQDFKAITAAAPGLFKRALTEILEKAQLRVGDVAQFIVHQATARYLDFLRQEFGIPEDRMVVDLDRVGNTGSASIYVALDRVARERRLRDGDVVVLLPAEATKWVYGGVALRWGRP